MTAWFEKQELGHKSDPDSGSLPNRSNNAKEDIMTSSTPNYAHDFPSHPDATPGKCNTLPFAHRKKHNVPVSPVEEPRGRRSERRRGSLGET